MKKRVFAFALVIALAILSTATAEGFWSFFSGAAEPVYTPVELPSQEDLSIIGISPKGDYLAFNGSDLGLIHGSTFMPFSRNESRGVRDEYGALEYWETKLPYFLEQIDDPICSPDGRWVILTSYVTWWSQSHPVFPVLIDTQTQEYFLLYSAPFKPGYFSDFVFFTAAVFSPDSQQLYIVLYDAHTIPDKPLGCTLFRWDVNTGERTDLSLIPADNFLEPLRDELSEQLGPDEIDALQKQFTEGHVPLYLINSFFLPSDGSILCNASSTRLNSGAHVMARIRFAESGDQATLELYPSGAAKPYDSNVFAAADQTILTYHASRDYKGIALPYFSTGIIGEASKCFYFLCESSDAEYPAIRLVESTPEEIAGIPVREWLSNVLTILDFALSPDGTYAAVHGHFMGFEYLLRIRLDDLKVATFLTATDGERNLPWSQSVGSIPNNHFIWSECGTILVTAYWDALAFRLD